MAKLDWATAFLSVVSGAIAAIFLKEVPQTAHRRQIQIEHNQQQSLHSGRWWWQCQCKAALIPHLFDSQWSSYVNVLDNTKNQQIAIAWALMKRIRSAVTQERMFRVELR
ncbi:MAG: hypothetical protein WA174_13945 [Rhodoferax sp.]